MRHPRLLFALLFASSVAHAAEVPRDGAPLGGDGPWTVAVELDGHLPDAISIAGRPVLDLTLYRGGLITLGGAVDVAAPRPLAELAMGSVIAPLWAPLEAGACPDGAVRGEVRRTDTPGGVRFAWIDVPPAGCPPGAEGATFSAELVLDGAGAVREIELRYEALPVETPDVEPRAGLAVRAVRGAGTTLELLPDGPEGPLRGRAKWLLEGSSDGEPGVWIIELGAEGGIVGDLDLDGRRSVDNCEDDFNPRQEDLDGDDRGDACEDDTDGDTVRDGEDNCPRVPNGLQADLDGDGRGDACDPDDDDDGWPDALDRCPAVFDAHNLDLDRDGIGDVCDHDPDGDDRAAGRWGWRAVDPCPWAPDPFGRDRDKDGLGDVCDLRPWSPCRGDCRQQSDADGDGFGDLVDRCPYTPERVQADRDGDGVGDMCDADADGDGVFDIYQLCIEGACPPLERPATVIRPLVEPG